MTLALRIALVSSLLLVASTNRALSSDRAKGMTTRAGYEAILADYDTAMKRFQAKADEVKTEREVNALYKTSYPDPADYSRRFVDLAASDPTDPAARDALVWVLTRCLHSRLDSSTPLFAEHVGRAVDQLILHHSDDLNVARLSLLLSSSQSADFDRLFTSLYERSKTREVKGTACLVLARHLNGKGKLVNRLRGEETPFRLPYEETDESGKKTTKLGEPLFRPAYEAHLRALDPDALDREAERLFARVIAEYADVPYAEGAGGPMTERSLARKRTLGQQAEASLDEKQNLAVGRPAPEIEGTGLDGKVMKLSDYRGKVVLLVFWGSWCGPCMGEVPHERELAERHKDRPFTILGVDCEEKKDDGLKAVEQEKMTWPSWFDGVPGEGPIVARYHVRAFPTSFVIDAKGLIRFKNAFGVKLDKAVEGLLNEAESAEE